MGDDLVRVLEVWFLAGRQSSVLGAGHQEAFRYLHRVIDSVFPKLSVNHAKL